MKKNPFIVEIPEVAEDVKSPLIVEVPKKTHGATGSFEGVPEPPKLKEPQPKSPYIVEIPKEEGWFKRTGKALKEEYQKIKEGRGGEVLDKIILGNEERLHQFKTGAWEIAAKALPKKRIQIGPIVLDENEAMNYIKAKKETRKAYYDDAIHYLGGRNVMSGIGSEIPMFVGIGVTEAGAVKMVPWLEKQLGGMFWKETLKSSLRAGTAGFGLKEIETGGDLKESTIEGLGWGVFGGVVYAGGAGLKRVVMPNVTRFEGQLANVLNKFTDRAGKPLEIAEKNEQLRATMSLIKAHSRAQSKTTNRWLGEKIAGLKNVEITSEDASKGATMFNEDGKAIISIFEGGNISTITKGLANIFRKELSDFDKVILEKEFRVKEGLWTPKHEEKFARAFERYLATQKAPTARTRAMFEKYADWLADIYEGVSGAPTIGKKMNRDVVAVMDGLVQKRNYGKLNDTLTSMATNWWSSLYPAEKMHIGLWEHGKMIIGNSDRGLYVGKENLKKFFKMTAGLKVESEGKTIEAQEFAAKMARAVRSDWLLKHGKKVKTGEEDYVKRVFEDFQKIEEPELQATLLLATQELGTASRKVLKYWLDNGVINNKQYAKMVDANPFHVPFYRLFERNEMNALPKQYGPTGNLKRYKGSEREINNVIDNVLQSYLRMIPRVDKHVWIRKVIDRAMVDPRYGGRGLIEKVPPKRIPFLKEKLNSVLKAEGLDKEIGPEGLSEAYSVFRIPWKLQDNQIAFMRDGKWEAYEINDKNLLGMIRGVRTPPAYEKAAMVIKNIKRAGVTMVPEFWIRNFIRDTMTHLVLDPSITAYNMPLHIVKMGYDYPRIFFNILGQGKKGTQFYNEMLKRGAGQSEFHAPRDIIDAQRLMAKEIRKMHKPTIVVSLEDIKRNPLESAKGVLDPLNRISSIFEMLPRMRAAELAYGRATAKGISHEVALDKAAIMFRESTADFSERGLTAEVVGRYAPFFTAGIAGFRTFSRALANDPEGVMSKSFVLVTVPSVWMWMENKDREWYQKLPDWEKNMFWCPTEHIRIPKPFEIGIMAGSMIERTLEFIEDRDPKSFMAIMKSFREAFPAPPWPSPVTAVEGLRTNKHPYFGTPIEPETFQELSPHLVDSPGTSMFSRGVIDNPIMRDVSDTIGLSPARLDFLVKEFLGAAGGYLLKPETFLSRQKVAGNQTLMPEHPLLQIPGSRAFYRPSPLELPYNTAIQEFYENYKDAKNVHDDIEKLYAGGAASKKEADALYNGPNGWKWRYHKIIMARKGLQVGQQLKYIRSLMNPKTETKMSAEQVRAEIMESLKRLNMLVDSVNNGYNDAEKENAEKFKGTQDE